MAVMPTPRHSAAKVRRLLALRQAEKLTFEQLSDRSGVPVHVLTYRASQDRQVLTESPAATTFVEVVEAPTTLDDPIVSASSSGIELLLAGGLRIRIERHFDEATLAQVLAIARC